MSKKLTLLIKHVDICELLLSSDSQHKVGRSTRTIFILLAETYVCKTKTAPLSKLWLGKLSKII